MAANWSFAGDKLSLTSSSPDPDKDFLVVGHRGAAGLAPENTLAAFKKACEIGVDAIELDVLLSADRKIIVHHDYQLKPETTRSPDGVFLRRPGPAIKDLNLTQLRTYDVGRLKPNTLYSRQYPEQQAVDGERIPALKGSMAFINTNCGGTTQLWIKIKTNPEKPEITPYPEMIADAVVLLLGEQNFAERVRTFARLKEAHQLGLRVYVWTVDSRAEMFRLLEMGVDGIITNRPDVLKLAVGSGR